MFLLPFSPATFNSNALFSFEGRRLFFEANPTATQDQIKVAQKALSEAKVNKDDFGRLNDHDGETKEGKTENAQGITKEDNTEYANRLSHLDEKVSAVLSGISDKEQFKEKFKDKIQALGTETKELSDLDQFLTDVKTLIDQRESSINDSFFKAPDQIDQIRPETVLLNGKFSQVRFDAIFGENGSIGSKFKDSQDKEKVTKAITEFNASTTKDSTSIDKLINAIKEFKPKAGPDLPASDQEKVNFTNFLKKDDKGKVTELKAAEFKKELERLVPTNAAVLQGLFPIEAFKNDPKQEAVLQKMVEILKLPPNQTQYPWVKPEMRNPENFPILKKQVEASEIGKIVNEGRQGISDKVDEALKNNKSGFLMVAEAFLGRDLLKNVLSNTGMIGSLARMVLGIKIDLSEETGKLRTQGEFVKKFLNGKETDPTKLREQLKKAIDISQDSTEIKDASISKIFGEALDKEYQTTNEIEKQQSSRLLKDISGRFGNNIPLQKDTQITTSETEKDAQSISFNTNSPIEASVIAEFYAPETNQMDFKNIMAAFKGVKGEADASKKASNMADQLKGKDPYADKKAGLPDHVLSHIEGTQVTLTWSKTNLLDRLREVWRQTQKPETSQKPPQKTETPAVKTAK